jgi:hypothetical protein
MENLLKEKLDEQQFITSKEKLGYTEEYIIVKGIKNCDGLLLNYSLSNSLDDIKIAIYARTNQAIDLENTYWQLNTKLSVSVKHLMNNHKVNYSMTVRGGDVNRSIVINMRVGDNWYYASFNEIEKNRFIGLNSIYKWLVKYYIKNHDDDLD